jgi:hypothetical protein
MSTMLPLIPRTLIGRDRPVVGGVGRGVVAVERRAIVEHEPARDRRLGDVAYRDGKLPRRAQGRGPVVGHDDSDRVHARPVAVGRRPREQTGIGVDARSRRRSGGERIRQVVAGVRIRADRTKRQQLSFVDFLIGDTC